MRGSSLVEAVIALGLLAGVLLASLGLFTMGGKGVASARSASAASLTARSILEEIEGWSFEDLHRKWGVDGAEVAYAFDASRWRPLLDGLPDAAAVIRVESIPFDGGAGPVAEAKGLRIVVTVAWSEAGRARETWVATARF